MFRGPHRAKLRRAAVRSGALVLSYDDGPGMFLTPRVLEVLAECGARATFFLLGMRAERAPETADSVVRAGHEVGCHGQEHVNAWRAWPWRAARDIEVGYQTLARWVAPDAIFRPPCGKMTPLTRWQVWRRGARVGWWTIDSGDTHERLPDPRTVVDAARRDGGGVVLMHDFDRSEETQRERSEYVLTVTRMLLEMSRREGYRVATLGEVMAETVNAER